MIVASCSADTGFKAEDLPRIALQPSDAPEGTRYWSKTSGPQDFDTFAGNEQAQRDLRAAGWRAGYAALFVEDGFDLDDQSKAPPDAVFVAALLSIYDNEDQARLGTEELYSGLEQKDPTAELLHTPPLGEESFGARGFWSEAEGGQPWLRYSWQMDNLSVHLSIQGKLSSEEALNLARKMEASASKLL